MNLDNGRLDRDIKDENKYKENNDLSDMVYSPIKFYWVYSDILVLRGC